MLLGTSRRTYGTKTVHIHAQIFNHALNLGVTNVGTIDMTNQVEQRKHGDKSNINLSEDLLSLLLCVVVVKVGIVRVQTEDTETADFDGFGTVLKVSRLLVGDLDVALGDGTSLSHGSKFL
ncbi:hypothetical protein HG531_001169 [Fusarium graminearum]|nr:hypothetical protein HG531_001169 [Fusarium graminearum]